MGVIDPQMRVQVYKRDGFKCRNCNRREGLHPHHLTYRSQGGKDTLDNLITLCYICHNGHHDGFLGILFTEQGANAEVRFIPKRGWRPDGKIDRRKTFRFSDIERIVSQVQEGYEQNNEEVRQTAVHDDHRD